MVQICGAVVNMANNKSADPSTNPSTQPSQLVITLFRMVGEWVPGDCRGR